MNNITQIKKMDCCGCTACYASCPTGAISMNPDYEGFLYPSIDNDKCIQCGKCLKVCEDVNLNVEFQKIYACWSKDNNLRAKSSFGGIFSHLAECVLLMGGVCVCMRL